MNELTVRASAGVRVPYEDNARRYITDSDTVTVPASAYYLRRLGDNDLVPASPDIPAPATITKPTSKEVTDGQS